MQRLKSLKKRVPTSGSIASSSTAPARPTPLKNENTKPTLKYQPRAVGRRSREEREANEKIESERHRERMAEAAAIQRGRLGTHPQRGAGSRILRGRGGVRGAGARRGRGGIMLTSDSRQSTPSQASQTRSFIETNNREASDSDSTLANESDSEVRMSIDRINLENDDDLPLEDDANGKKVAKSVTPRRAGAGGLRPVRLPWIEHKERVVSVNMESSSRKPAELPEEPSESNNDGGNGVAASSQTLIDDSDALFVPAYGEAQTINTTESGHIKEEPTDVESQGLGAIPYADDAAARKERQQPKDAEKSHLGTNEDIEEFDRHEADLRLMRELFTTSTADSTSRAEDQEDEYSDKPDKFAGQLFLMQFPPKIPNLIVPGETPTQGRGQDNDSNAPGAGTSVKREGGDVEPPEEPAPENASPPPRYVTATDHPLPSGRVGKLNVHASGRITMDWGGIPMELDRAATVGFLQEALIASRNDEVDEEQGEEEGERTVWSMGQLSGKFTVTPEWDKML